MAKWNPVLSALDDVLKPLGFLRKGLLWNRRTGNIVHAIELQYAKAGDRYTVNAGVIHCEVYRVMWGEPAPEFLPEADGLLRRRIYVGDGLEGWWDKNDPAQVLKMAELFEDQILPFLDSLHNEADMLRALEKTPYKKLKLLGPMPPIGYGILMHLSGKAEKASRHFAEISANTNALDKILEVQARLARS